MKILGVLILLILLAATLGSALAVVQTRQHSRTLFVELSRLGNERDDLNFEFGRLQLEQATWAENNRVEQIARGKLGMISQGQAETVVVQR